MLSFAIAWELWLRTRSTFALGLVGLVQVIPVILLSLPGGHLADQRDHHSLQRGLAGNKTDVQCTALNTTHCKYGGHPDKTQTQMVVALS